MPTERAGQALPISSPNATPPRTHAAKHPTLGTVVGAFKSISAIGSNRLLGRSGQSFWQRNYYEPIIRNEAALQRVRDYIAANPANWQVDPEYQNSTGR